jgi:hypothetical protein
MMSVDCGAAHKTEFENINIYGKYYLYLSDFKIILIVLLWKFCPAGSLFDLDSTEIQIHTIDTRVMCSYIDASTVRCNIKKKEVAFDILENIKFYLIARLTHMNYYL